MSTKYKLSQRVWIVHEPEGFYALLAICTRPGCTPDRLDRFEALTEKTAEQMDTKTDSGFSEGS